MYSDFTSLEFNQSCLSSVYKLIAGSEQYHFGTTATITSNSNANSSDNERNVYIQPESKAKCKAALGREIKKI